MSARVSAGASQGPAAAPAPRSSATLERAKSGTHDPSAVFLTLLLVEVDFGRREARHVLAFMSPLENVGPRIPVARRLFVVIVGRLCVGAEPVAAVPAGPSTRRLGRPRPLLIFGACADQRTPRDFLSLVMSRLNLMVVQACAMTYSTLIHFCYLYVSRNAATWLGQQDR